MKQVAIDNLLLKQSKDSSGMVQAVGLTGTRMNIRGKQPSTKFMKGGGGSRFRT